MGEYLWSEFQLILMVLTGVIAPNPPKWAQLGSKTKNIVLLLGKVENEKYTETGN